MSRSLQLYLDDILKFFCSLNVAITSKAFIILPQFNLKMIIAHIHN